MTASNWLRRICPRLRNPTPLIAALVSARLKTARAVDGPSVLMDDSASEDREKACRRRSEPAPAREIHPLVSARSDKLSAPSWPGRFFFLLTRLNASLETLTPVVPVGCRAARRGSQFRRRSSKKNRGDHSSAKAAALPRRVPEIGESRATHLPASHRHSARGAAAASGQSAATP